MLKRLYPPTLTEFARFNTLLFPSGILPALALATVRRKDAVGWSIGIVTITYFAVLYAQAWTAVHQFTPIMVLPLVVFWRFYLGRERRIQNRLLVALLGTTTIAALLSLPRHFRINTTVRQFGMATEFRIGDYGDGYEEAVQAGTSLNGLLPSDYRLDYPDQPWGTDPLSWIYYAFKEKPAGAVVNYVVQDASEVPPEGAQLVHVDDGAAVFVHDARQWRAHREPGLPRVVVSPLYEPILRNTYGFFRDYVTELESVPDEAGAPDNK